MEELPDEILLYVLRSVVDGVTLLHSVPLVCKRWHRVAREPRVWEGAELVVRRAYEKREDLMRDARVLLLAPRLRHLQFCLSDQYARTEDDDIKLSALRRSVASVTSIQLPELASSHHTAVDEVVHYLWRQRDSLRALDADIGEDEGEEYLLDEAGEMIRPLVFLGVLAKLHRLTELKLKFIYFDYLDIYNDKLADGLPGLRRLELRTTQELCGLTDGDQMLMKDLVRGAAPTVRVIALVPYAYLYPEIEEGLALCTEVRSLDMNLFNLPVVLGMHHLERLRLHCDVEPSQMSQDSIESLCTGLLSTEALSRLSSLQYLELHTFYDEDPAETAKKYQPIHPAAFDLLLAVARSACSVTDVKLSLTNRPRVQEMLACLPHARSVEVEPIGPADLETLAAMPELRKLSGRLQPVEGSSCSCGPEQHDHCKEAIRAFRLCRPDVTLALSIGDGFSSPWYSEESNGSIMS